MFYFFMKNLTSRKFTGTQMANMGIGAQCLLTPRWMKRLSVTICKT